MNKRDFLKASLAGSVGLILFGMQRAAAVAAPEEYKGYGLCHDVRAHRFTVTSAGRKVHLKRVYPWKMDKPGLLEPNPEYKTAEFEMGVLMVENVFTMRLP